MYTSPEQILPDPRDQVLFVPTRSCPPIRTDVRKTAGREVLKRKRWELKHIYREMLD